jgi:hypothetical protein
MRWGVHCYQEQEQNRSRNCSGTLWVPNWSSASCDLGVFVYQPTEQIARRREAGMATQALVVINGRPRVPLTGESRAVERPQSDSPERTRRSSGEDRGYSARSSSSPRRPSVICTQINQSATRPEDRGSQAVQPGNRAGSCDGGDDMQQEFATTVSGGCSEVSIAPRSRSKTGAATVPGPTRTAVNCRRRTRHVQGILYFRRSAN